MEQIKLSEVKSDVDNAIGMKELLTQYKDIESVPDIKLKELLYERQKLSQRLTGKAVESKQLFKKMQELAGKLTGEVTELNGAIKYVDAKIKARHVELNK